ncbi:MAG TPA: hypothetical protein VH933_04965 [Aestuariivirgaceae bacterium]
MLKQLLIPAVLVGLAASTSPSLAWNSTQGVVIDTPVPGITVVTVTSTTVDREDFGAEPPAVNVTNFITVIVYPRNSRLEQLRRAFGHRYLGFKKVYSGPRYPF